MDKYVKNKQLTILNWLIEEIEMEDLCFRFSFFSLCILALLQLW